MIATASLIVSLLSNAPIAQGRGGVSPIFVRVDADSNALATAKALYESASYEAALELLAALDKPDALEQIELYRALCLLALGRTAEAEKSLARIVLRKPLYKPDESETPPRLVALFKDVRKRTLPAAARELYSRQRRVSTTSSSTPRQTNSRSFSQFLLTPEYPTTTPASQISRCWPRDFSACRTLRLLRIRSAPSPARPQTGRRILRRFTRRSTWTCLHPWMLERKMPVWDPPDRGDEEYDIPRRARGHH